MATFGNILANINEYLQYLGKTETGERLQSEYSKSVLSSVEALTLIPILHEIQISFQMMFHEWGRSRAIQCS